MNLVASNTGAAYHAIDRVIRQHSKTFYFATGLLPRAKRQAIRSLYAFCRCTDDLVDADGATLADIQSWREQVSLGPEQQTNPVLQAWAITRAQFRVDRRYETELIEGVGQDVQFRPYPTWQSLQEYCYRVASTVGLMSIPIIGLAPRVQFDQAAPYAIRLGIALQLTNILRDVGEDLDRGRIYFPLEDLERFKLSLRDIQRRVFDQRFIDLMRFEISRARQLYHQALPGIAFLARSARVAVTSAALLYAAILDEIEVIAYNVYHQRAFTSTARKVGLLPTILLKVVRLRAPAK